MKIRLEGVWIELLVLPTAPVLPFYILSLSSLSASRRVASVQSESFPAQNASRIIYQTGEEAAGIGPRF